MFCGLFLNGINAEQVQDKVIRYYNGKILRNHQLKEEDLWIKCGKIVSPQVKADVEIDVGGLIIAPGYIDLQINGGFGFDFSSDPQQVEYVASRLPQYGVTAFLPTLVCSSKEQYCRSIPLLQPRSLDDQGASILGIHLEGPFFNPRQCGAHNPALIQIFKKGSTPEDYYGSLEGVKIVTLAPEIEGAIELIRSLKERNIIVSAGHTNASYEDMEKAVEAGACLATHLFNAMAPFHHRKPGLIGYILNHPKIYYSVIADGIHLHPATINLSWNANAKGLVLISDAIMALGLSEGIYHLGNMQVQVEEGKATVVGTDIIAGSILSMDAAVRNLRNSTKCTIVEAIESATLKPASILGIQASKGTLEIGADADFIFLDNELNVKACFIAGKVAFQGRTE